MTSYLLAGGGTAGHVNPLLATADFFRTTDPSAKFTVLGTEAGLETKLVPQRGYSLELIPKVVMPRRLNKESLKFPGRFVKAIRQVREIIRAQKVDVVIGFGGFVSAPAYLAGWLEKTPIVVHEGNAIPGFANRLGSRLSKFVAVAFRGTKLRNARFVGMPMRKEISGLNREEGRIPALKYFGFAEDRPTLLVTGGSLGARAINSTVEKTSNLITESGWNVLHIVGPRSALPASESRQYRPLQYCDRMDLAFSVADFAISRAGSATISELTGLGIPSVLIPYESGNGEQTHNAQEMVESGGAILVKNEQFQPDWIRESFMGLIADSSRIAAMARAAKSVGVLDGAERLAQVVAESLESHEKEHK